MRQRVEVFAPTQQLQVGPAGPCTLSGGVSVPGCLIQGFSAGDVCSVLMVCEMGPPNLGVVLARTGHEVSSQRQGEVRGGRLKLHGAEGCSKCLQDSGAQAAGIWNFWSRGNLGGSEVSPRSQAAHRKSQNLRAAFKTLTRTSPTSSVDQNCIF